MKIAYCSDLHLEFRDIVLPKVDADVLVLAGDIMLLNMLSKEILHPDYTNPLIDFIDNVTSNYKDVIWVMGNHEYYSTDFNALNKIKHLLQSYTNLHILENESIVIDGVKIIGGTMWTDLNLNDPRTVMAAPSMLNDFNQIKGLTTGVWWDMHARFRDYLEEEVTDNCVVITHHSPVFETIQEKWRGSVIMNGLYASNLNAFIMDNNIKLWIHGHLHGAYEVQIDDCLITSNTRGYPREECFAAFELKVIDVSN